MRKKIWKNNKKSSIKMQNLIKMNNNLFNQILILKIIYKKLLYSKKMHENFNLIIFIF